MTYLRKSANGGFEVRIVVPKNLRPQVGKASLTRRLGRVSKSEANRLAAPFIEKFHTRIARARSGEAEPAQSGIVLTSPTIVPEEARRHPAASLMQLFDAYVRERQPSPSTIKRWRPVIVNLVDHLGHDDASRVTGEAIIEWKEALDRQGVGGRTIREVYLAAAKVMFGWAVENRKLAVNPATGVTVRVPKRQKLRGASFTPAEVRTILQASLLRDQGRISPEHALARRWVPWLCAYSGARVGEIAQMRGSDIIQMEGIWVMRITPEAGSTKSGMARIVPLHPHLIGQGVITMVEREGSGPLFYNPQRGRGGAAGNAHHKKIGERLAKWVRELGVDDPHVQPNHGWRHLFKTLARRVGIEPEIRDVLQGHVPRSVGEGYGEWPIETLALAINRIPFFELSGNRALTAGNPIA